MQRTVLWGTGGNAKKALERFPCAPIDIVAVVDSDPKKQGTTFHSWKVLAPQALASLDFDILAVASCHYEAIRTQAHALGIPDSKICGAASLMHFLHTSGTLPFEDILALSRVGWWFHSYEIAPGIHTPGVCPYKEHLLDFPELADLSGKRVLDIGAWDGPYTLEMSRRGGTVTGFDIQRPDRTGFNLMRSLNAVDAGHICANVYDLNPKDHGTYDLVTFFGVYYHLRNPVAAFANINNVLPTGGLAAVEGAILEGAPAVDEYWKQNAHLLESIKDVPLAYFVEGGYQGEWSNWWVPNACCLKQWITSCGFEVLAFRTAESGSRGVCLARKMRDMAIEHFVY